MALLAINHLRERAVLPAALPGAGQHAAADSGLLGAIHRIQHDLVHRRFRFRAFAAAVRVGADQVRQGRSEGQRQGMGRAERAGVDRALAGPVPYL